MRTQPQRFASILSAFLAIIVATPALAAGQQHPTTEPHGQIQLNAGKKWATDEPLRQGMANIRSLMAEKLPAIHGGKLGAEEYRTLGKAIEGQVGDIIARCKLDPKADAVLHPILAEALAGADAMQGKGKLRPAEGAQRVVRALDDYGRYFDHPGWTAPGP